MTWQEEYRSKISLSINWREEFQRRKIAVEEAIKLIKPGNLVIYPTGRDPQALGLALASQREQLANVRVFVATPTFDFGWYDPGWEDFFSIILGYTFPRGVAADCLAKKRADTAIGGLFIFGEFPDMWDVDVVMVEISPPDDNGFCSFGAAVYDKRHWIAKARLVIAEVNDQLIRTCGDNFVHISQIDYFVEHPHSGRKPGEVSLAGRPLPPVTEEQRRIAQYVSSLIKDGATIQVGQGGTSEALVRAGLLDGKQDIGWHSEVTPGGVIRLVMKGIITGQRKTIDRGKAVATAMGGGTIEEMNFAHLNPMFELRDIDYTHDPRVISQLDNIVTINNALEVDLTGQVNAESKGSRMFSGAGGLLTFSVGAQLAKNGCCIIVLPSTAQGGTVSRIVPMLDSKVTVPHTLAHYVVTEWGIAQLRAKTQRQRSEELIAVAHPDFRGELRKAAKNLYWP